MQLKDKEPLQYDIDLPILERIYDFAVSSLNKYSDVATVYRLNNKSKFCIIDIWYLIIDSAVFLYVADE